MFRVSERVSLTQESSASLWKPPHRLTADGPLKGPRRRQMGDREAVWLLQDSVFRARTVGEVKGGEAGVQDVTVTGLGRASAASVEEANDWHPEASGSASLQGPGDDGAAMGALALPNAIIASGLKSKPSVVC